jgi:hypothetical protein
MKAPSKSFILVRISPTAIRSIVSNTEISPSNKAAWVNGVSLPRRGYPVGLWNANALTSDDKFDASARDAGDFSIRNWLGILGGGASTNIIHTDMYGQIDIEITLDQAGILMLGAAPIAAAAGTLDNSLKIFLALTPSSNNNLCVF